MIDKKIEDKIDSLVERAKAIRDRYYKDVHSNMVMRASDKISDLKSEFNAFIVSCKNFIRLTSGKDSEFYNSFDYDFNYSMDSMDRFYSTLLEFQSEIKNGWIGNFKSIVSAEIFSDYLEMADHLLMNKYKDPSAVLIGSTLENGIKQLCVKNKVPIEFENGKGKLVPKKASTLNDELVKASVFNKLTQKQVTAWLGLRNDAAHGNYNEYDLNDVKNMLDGVRNFLIKYT